MNSALQALAAVITPNGLKELKLQGHYQLPGEDQEQVNRGLEIEPSSQRNDTLLDIFISLLTQLTDGGHITLMAEDISVSANS